MLPSRPNPTSSPIPKTPPASEPHASEQKLNQVEAHAAEAPDPIVPELPPLAKAAALIVLIWGIIEGKPFLLPLSIAALLAFLMAPLQRFLSKKARLPEFISILLSAIVLISPLVGVGFLLVDQGQNLIEDFPNLMRSAQSEFTKFARSDFGRRFGLNERLEGNFDMLLSRLGSSAGMGINLLVGGLSAIAGAGSQGLLILVFSLMMLGTRGHLKWAGEEILARSRQLHTARVLDQVVDLVQQFLVARLLIVVIIGLMSVAALAAFGVKYSIFLGAFLGLMTLVPAIGFILALIPSLIVAALSGFSIGTLALLAGVLVAINAIENYVLTPKLVGNRLNINVLSAFVGLFAGGLLWGIWGMLLSVPALGVIRIVFSAIPSMQPWGDLLADKTERRPPSFVRHGRHGDASDSKKVA